MSNDIVDLITSKHDVRNAKRKRTGKEKFWLAFRYTSLAIIWFLVIMPIYVMVVNSLKGVKNVYLTNAFQLPKHLDFSAWSCRLEWCRFLPTRSIRIYDPNLVLRNSIINHFSNSGIDKWLHLC
jgi:glucose/mannose transport system permease protein